MTRSGRAHLAAIAVTLSPEVLVARTASGPAIRSSRSNRSCLNSMFSGADSITRSAPATDSSSG